MSHVKKTESCWIWKGKIGNSGYGVFNRKESSHRKSYELFKGEVEPGLCVCHTCDNPKCVNPDHLWIGTQKENITDSINKGRFR